MVLKAKVQNLHTDAARVRYQRQTGGTGVRWLQRRAPVDVQVHVRIRIRQPGGLRAAEGHAEHAGHRGEHICNLLRLRHWACPGKRPCCL